MIRKELPRMLFSIIVPIYNVSNYLPDCVENVLSQSFKDWELILVDDGSSDGCGAMCDEYAGRDSRIKVIHKANGGLSDARNAGLAAATGEYVHFLDGDDWITEGALEDLARIIDLRNPDLIFCHFIYTYPDYTTYSSPIISARINDRSKEDVIQYMLCEYGDTPWAACRYIIRRKILQEHNLLFKVGILCEDAEFFPRVIVHANVFSVYEKPHYYYRRGVTSSIMYVDNPKRELDLLDTIEKHFRFANEHVGNASIRQSVITCFADYYAKVLLAGEPLYRREDKLIVREAVQKRLYLLDYVKGTKAVVIRRIYRIFGYHITAYLTFAIWRIKIKSRRVLKKRG